MAKSEKGIAVIDKKKADYALRKPRKYNVIILNDDFTPAEFVIKVLKTIFRKTTDEASIIMLQAHITGSGLAGTYTHEIAETKTTHSIRMANAEQHPFQVTMEPV